MVQLGQGRGGFYSYSWLENLFAADMHNVNEILPELQQLQVGDRLALMRGGEQSPVTSTEVTLIEPGHALVLGEGWTLALVPVDAQTTRLIVRYPWVVDGPANALYYYPIFEPAHFLMESGMMLGIKTRAEREWTMAGPTPVLAEVEWELDKGGISRRPHTGVGRGGTTMSTIAYRGMRSQLAWGEVAQIGALTGVALTYAYALVFLLYATLRATFTLVTMPWPDAGLLGRVIATSALLAVPALVLATLLAIPAAVLGALTAVLVYAVLLWLNTPYSPVQAALIGGAIALAVVALIRLGLMYGLGVTVASLTLPTYLFWLGQPAVIYVVAAAIGGVRLNRRLHSPPSPYGW